jgi:fimbrial isopeptide formation D2 family protein
LETRKQNEFMGRAGILLANMLLLMAALFAFGSLPVRAATIANTASARWTQGGIDLLVQSNTVSFDVEDAAASLSVLPASTAADALSISPSFCGGQPLAAARIDAAGMDGTTTSAISSIHIGQPLVFRLVLPRANLSATAIDTVTVTVTSASGDEEHVTVSETAVNSGVFAGAMPTSAIPPSPTSGDCHLSVSSGDRVTIECRETGTAKVIVATSVEVLADPFGVIFDAEDGSTVDGARITLIDVATGLPAQVFADDGVTAWPSTVVSGQPVTDAGGTVWPMPVGEYRFPLARLGSYRLKIEPPAPYTAPSQASTAQLSGLVRPDGGELLLVPASFGSAFVLDSPTAVRVDIPVDRPAVAVSIAKVASRQVASPGDAVFYTVTVRNPDATRAKRSVVLVDRPASVLRLRPDTIRVDGVAAPTAVTIAPDGHTLTLALGTIAPSATRTVTYAMTVRPDAGAGQALNRAEAMDSRGLTATASAVVRIERDNLAATMTLVGRISAGDCSVTQNRPGLRGVRVVLEDGSFAVTDGEGRYHFEGLAPGSHVVEAQGVTLPNGGHFVDCARSTRSAGSAASRFIIGQGGSLVTADFAAVVPETAAAAAPVAEAPATPADDSDRTAAGAETDWLALGDGPTGFIFPTPDHNPRAPTVRVVIRHRAGQTVGLKVDGKPVDKLAFEGAKVSPEGFAVSVWRGIPLYGEDTQLEAEVHNADGSTSDTVRQSVHFNATPARVEMIAERSHLIADGQTRPVVAVRVLDRAGRPVHAGISGQFTLSAPYESAQAFDAMQSRILAGLDHATPTWTVKGDDGIALIELAPTMVSGGLDLTFTFSDRDVKRQQVVEAVVIPGEQKWTLVGLAEGAVGAKTVADAMQRTGHFDSDLGRHARVALYAKGRVLGRFLTTLAYDSAKQRDEQRLLGGLDPQAYYTVFADGSDRRFDAASRNKLYLRIESRAVRALFGDFNTGFNRTQLARYERTTTGVKAEVRTGAIQAQAFAAKIATSHRRDELPGGGISGPYRLSSRAIVANSEAVSIEVRDRFRSELVTSKRTLIRFVDYDIDMVSATITFKSPVLSRDENLNPQIIIVEYEIDTLRGGALNAGARAEWHGKGDALRIGGTVISDKGDAARTGLAAVDARARFGTGTELRAEAAASRTVGATTSAWLIEAEHHDERLDVLAYARSIEQGFGLGQVSGGELGHRKLGLDARLALREGWSVGASGWYDDTLTDPSHRDAVQLRTTYTTQAIEARLGLSRYSEHRADGTGGATTLVEAGAARRYFDNRLELSATGTVSLGKDDTSSYQPPRYRVGARYAITPNVRLVGDYEVAKGTQGDSRIIRSGLEVSPWTGARMVTTVGQQAITEQGKRAFAAYGLAQSLPVGRHLTLDASVDGNRVIGGGGARSTATTTTALGVTATTVAEDFTAYTLGAAWRAGRWSATARAELRNGELARRKGVTFGAIRQLGEGSVVGGSATWTTSHDATGASTEVATAALSVAHRPADAALAFLGKLEFRSDVVHGAVAGDAGAAGQTALVVDGDARSRRIVASLSTDWTPYGRDGEALVQRTEIGLFAAARHNLDRYQGVDLAGTTVLGGMDLRLGIGDRIEIGGSATVRRSLSDGTTAFAIGPQIGVVPAANVLFVIGYNVTGFRDRDFAAARSTDKGVFATLRMKFDSNSLAFLGIGR